MSKVTLNELINRVHEIPVFPQMISRIITMTEDPKTTVKDIENEIIKDQGLTAKVLKLANSAYYGVSRNIGTVSEAVVLLGFQAIKGIMFATTANKILKVELPGYALKEEELWKQSQISAITARLLAKKLKYPKPDQAYTAGLLKDIGKVILDHYLKDDFLKILDIVESEHRSFIDVEAEVLGFHHGQVGQKIAERWNLPIDLVEAIAYHHEPLKANVNLTLTAITHVADAIVMMMGLNLGGDGLAYDLSSDVIMLLRLDENIIQQTISEIIDIVNDENNFISVV